MQPRKQFLASARFFCLMCIHRSIRASDDKSTKLNTNKMHISLDASIPIQCTSSFLYIFCRLRYWYRMQCKRRGAFLLCLRLLHVSYPPHLLLNCMEILRVYFVRLKKTNITCYCGSANWKWSKYCYRNQREKGHTTHKEKKAKRLKETIPSNNLYYCVHWNRFA